MAVPTLYTRVVVSFSASAPPAAVDAVIELARALGDELLAVLLEDIGAQALAELPSSRAFDPRGAVWRDVRPGELLRELELAASALRRRLEDAQAAGVRTQVRVARGGAGSVFGQYAQAGDLLVVTEPADTMARWLQPFAALVEAALASPAPVLYLPHQGMRRRGPVGAIGGGAAADLARRVARALGVPMLEIEAGPAAPAQTLSALLPLLLERRVRLVVCDRAALGADARRALQEAGDQRLAVLLAPARDTG
jgi:hypothetical protein